jgi:sulfate/thiosulfate transport system permease protein
VAARLALRGTALAYLLVILLAPLGVIFYRALEHGLGPVWDELSSADFRSALWLTVRITLIAVPICTVLGVLTALVLVRRRVPGKSVWTALIDLPLALSPVVIGLALILVYGQDGWFGGWLTQQGIQVIFSTPGMILATMFVSLPFVVREVMPVLREIGDEQEQAASTLGASGFQTFWRVTLPSIRWGLTYGVVLATARALGEFGAVSVVSGKLSGQTETLTLFVENRFHQFDLTGAYAASVVLALIAFATLLGMTLFNKRREA